MIMKFKSKTALHAHIKELEDSGYLIPEWHKQPMPQQGKTIVTKMYKVNFNNE